MIEGKFNLSKGIILEGCFQGIKTRDIKFGLYFEMEFPVVEDYIGELILVDRNGCIEFFIVDPEDMELELEDNVDRQMNLSENIELRLLFRETLLEIYLNNFLIRCFCLPHTPTGRIGIVTDKYADNLSDFHIWKMEL